jgi:hypothetical protein
MQEVRRDDVHEATDKQNILVSSARTLGDVSQELASWVPVLRRLAEAESLRNIALGHCSDMTSATIRSVITARRLRDEYFWPAMSEAAWSVLLELFANRLEGGRVDAQHLGAATELPLETVLHWVEWLAGRGMVFRLTDTDCPETAPLDLTETGTDQMRAYFFAALKLSPWVQ